MSMAIRVAGLTFAFGKMGLEESCQIMQEMGFDVVDVGACGTSTFTEYVPQWFFKNVDDIKPLHTYARHFQAKPDEGWVDFGRMIKKMHDDAFNGFISVEFVSAPEVIEAGWDIRKESARLKEILDDALESTQR